MKPYQKILSVFLMVSMLLGLLPISVYASVSLPEKVIKDGKVYIYANGTHIVVKEDGVYDTEGKNKYINIDISTVECVFGGTYDAGTSVPDTKVVLESGNVNKLYGGGYYGDVIGQSEVIVKGGFAKNLYGGCNYGSAGSVRLELNNNSDLKMTHTMSAGLSCKVNGDVNVILNNPYMTSFVGGNQSGAEEIKGNINITINGGSIDKIYGGSASTKSYVRGTVNFTFTGKTEFGFFQPMGKSVDSKGNVIVNGGVGVDGGANVYIPRETYTEEEIATIQTNSNICVFYNDGEQISGPRAISYDIDKKAVYANGATVTIKTYEADGNTYIYNSTGTKQLIKFPINGYTIYGGSTTKEVESSSVTMESGNIAAIYGGGLNGSVIGNSYITVNGGVVDSVYGSGLNGSVTATAHIKVAKEATVTGNVYSNTISGNANASVIWVPEDFQRVFPGENVRMFKGSAELVDTNIKIPDGVTLQGNYVFANGIPVIIKKDANDGRTYIYDSAGLTKLLNTEVNDREIYGGSYKGAVDSTNVKMESGTVLRIYGGGYTGSVKGIAKVTVTGGDITEVIYGGSYDGDVGGTDVYTDGPYVAKGIYAGSRNGCVLGDTKVVLKDSVAKGLYAGTGGEGRGAGYPDSDVLGNASLTLIDGMFENLYGGCKSGVIKGTSTITLNGQVIIKKSLDPLSQMGVIGGSIINVPENYAYINKIGTGEGITINLTEPAEDKPLPDIIDRTSEVFSTENDSGKLVFRFINIPEPNGDLKGRPGEAYYITFPDGTNMLVDAGGDTDSSEAIITGFLDRLGVKDIDYVVASHYHADHIGRMLKIINKYNVGKLYTTGFNVGLSGAYYKDLKAWMASNPDKVTNLWSGDKFAIDGVEIEVLNPANDVALIKAMEGNNSEVDINNSSIVMKLTYGNNSALLTGDLYIDAEKKLIETYGAEKLKSDLLKVPHHGDTTSSDPEFVAAVSPEVAVLPDFSDTIIVNNRYREVGADTYVTGVDGITKVSLDGMNSPQVIAQYVIAEPSVDLSGGFDTITVESGKETVASYTYTVKDQFGNIMNSAKVTRTITDDSGNFINDPAITFVGDTLTVKGIPNVSYIVVNYIYGNCVSSKRTVFVKAAADDDSTPETPGWIMPETPKDDKPEVVKNPDGSTTVIVAISEASVENALKNNDNNSFAVNVDTKANESIVKLTEKATQVLSARKADLIIKTEAIELNIPYSVVDIAAIAEKLGTKEGNINLEVKIAEVPKNRLEYSDTAKLKPSDKVYEFTITASNGEESVTIDSFGNSYVVGTLPLPSEFALEDEARINVYRYNEAKKTLELCPTKVIDGKIVFKTNSFSLYTVMLNTIAFSDVTNHWSEKYVHTLAAKNIINGKGENIFDPEGKMTRAEFASLVARLLDLPKDEDAGFNDVKKDSWYYDSINSASAAGLITGNGDGTFSPEQLISREEMAVIALRVYKYTKGTTQTPKTVAEFSDSENISQWAIDDVSSAYSLGLVKGSGGMFSPKSDMTRAEGATILYNLLIKLDLI